MEVPGTDHLTAHIHCTFSHLWIFTESITGLEFFGDIEDTAHTKKVSFTIVKDNAAKTILATLTKTQVTTTLGVGDFRYDIKARNTTSGAIMRKIQGKFNVAYSETELT